MTPCQHSCSHPRGRWPITAVERSADDDGSGALAATTDSSDAIRATCERTLALLKAWLADGRLSAAKLVVMTKGALAPYDEETPDLAQAALVGLMRSARSEHPERFLLVDIDRQQDWLGALHGALLSNEPELALRRDRLHVPRLSRVQADEHRSPPPVDPDGTILITGGTGGLGALVALHLVKEHGARRLLLVSRRGPEATGADELTAALARLGCAAQIACCDVSDRMEVERLLESIPTAHPLTAVIHTVGVLAGGGDLESLTAREFLRGHASQGGWGASPARAD